MDESHGSWACRLVPDCPPTQVWEVLIGMRFAIDVRAGLILRIYLLSGSRGNCRSVLAAGDKPAESKPFERGGATWRISFQHVN
jgi:hypothetical protein